MSVNFFSEFGFSEKSVSQAADSIRSTTSYIAQSGWSLARSVGNAVSSVLYPKNGYVGVASTVFGLYARSQTLIHGPAVLAKACEHVTCSYLGSATGKVVSELVVAPTVVPSLTPVAAGLAAAGATVVTIAAFSYFGAYG